MERGVYDGVVWVEIDIGMGLLCTVCAPMEMTSVVRQCKHHQLGGGGSPLFTGPTTG